MKLLALDTSSEGCSAALWLDGRITERFELAPRGHTRLLMPMVRELLAEQGFVPTDLDALAFARGPGSFTGLRIATGVVQGLAWGLSLPVVPVSSLAAVALGAIEEHQLADGDLIAVAFDARMGKSTGPLTSASRACLCCWARNACARQGMSACRTLRRRLPGWALARAGRLPATCRRQW